MNMNVFKRTLAAGAVVGLFALPFVASAQTTDGTGDTGTTGDTTTQQQGTGTGDTTTGTGGTTVTPGVPSTGVGDVQALANVVLLAASAATALVGGYFLTVGRKNVA
jgi:hypothetical protein